MERRDTERSYKEKSELKKVVDRLYEIPKFTEKHSLEHTRLFLQYLKDPQEAFQVIHVAGSNGKGSVCMFISQVLLEAGRSVGLFTSPHLVDVRERFMINGELCAVSDFLEVYQTVKQAADYFQQKNLGHPTFFEFIFAMGMLLFQKAGVEYVVLETGLGGRLDATNCVEHPILTVLTSISLEHTEILGDTLEQIAFEKAGIMKPGVPVVFDANCTEAVPVIGKRAELLGCRAVGIDAGMCKIREIKNKFIDFSLCTEYDKGTSWQIPSVCTYQAMNGALAVTALRLLPKTWNLADEVIRQGLKKAVWPGRMEEVLPEIYLDGAHNTAGIREFLRTVKALCKEDDYKPMLLFSIVKEKDYHQVIRMLMKEQEWELVAVSTMPNLRGIPAETLKQLFETDTGVSVKAVVDYREAFRLLQKKKKDGQKLFCTGSLYFAGALKQMLLETTCIESEGGCERD